MECLRRQYDCPHCEEAGEYEERTTSHLDECPMIEVPCPKRECKENILRRNVTEHLSECMFEDVPCKYANIGCKEKVIRRDLHQLEKHEGESQQHLQLAINAVQQQQLQIQSLQKKHVPTAKFLYKFISFDHHRKMNDTTNTLPIFSSSPEWYRTVIPEWYRIELCIKCNGKTECRNAYVSVNAYLNRGPVDDNLIAWQFTGTVTTELLNQLED